MWVVDKVKLGGEWTSNLRMEGPSYKWIIILHDKIGTLLCVLEMKTTEEMFSVIVLPGKAQGQECCLE